MNEKHALEGEGCFREDSHQFGIRIEEETCVGGCIHILLYFKKWIPSLFLGQCLYQNGFILYESYENVLQYGVLHLTFGAGQSKSIPSKNKMRNMFWQERDASEKMLTSFK